MKMLVLVAIACSAATSSFAAAPGADQTKVEAALTSQGYAKWKRIEFDNGVWEVDDAIDASGKQFDLRIDAANLKTVAK